MSDGPVSAGMAVWPQVTGLGHVYRLDANYQPYEVHVPILPSKPSAGLGDSTI